MDFGLTYVSAVLGCMQGLVSWEVDEGGGSGNGDGNGNDEGGYGCIIDVCEWYKLWLSKRDPQMRRLA